MILDGRVFVNDRIVTTLGRKVDPAYDRITVDGYAIAMRPTAELKWVALYKPKGYVCTMDDEKGRKTVMELVREFSPISTCSALVQFWIILAMLVNFRNFL